MPDSPAPGAADARRNRRRCGGRAASGEGGDRYDFYDMLPNFEVVVPEKDREVKRDQPAARSSGPGVYVLQAGSYRNVPDAERVRAQLAFRASTRRCSASPSTTTCGIGCASGRSAISPS